jgi:hypothetical protein
MIVNPTPQGWEIIFQRAHALLAARLAYHLHEKLRTDESLWLEMLSSIAEHDDGQQDWKDKNHLTEAGAPKDLTQQKYDLEQAQNVVAESAQKSRWIALMASLHAYHLHRPFQGDSRELDAFLEEQLVYQKSLRKSLGISKEASESAYTIMRWCDECSLVLCKSQIPLQGRKLEIGRLPADTPRFIFRQEDKVCVSPWPFDTDTFELSVEYYTVEQLAFESDEALIQQLRRQSPEVRRWQMMKG